MTDKIFPKRIKGIDYYYYQYTYREKIDANDATKGKGPGSGKSRVKTHSEYLGTARFIRDKLKESKSGPVDVKHLNFGAVAASYTVAKKIGLIDILKKHIAGSRFGIPQWLFFFVAIINRMDHSTSKEKMGKWAAATILPQLLGFDPTVLNSQTFWYVTDDITSERKLRERRAKNESANDDIFVDLDDSILRTIEQELFANVREQFSIEPKTILYDTTNFFTYIQPQTPSELAKSGHNKESRHHLKQVGLVVSVENDYGLPFFHRIYRGNSHDSITFFSVIDELIEQVKLCNSGCDKITVILDKGNNSDENFNKMKDKLDWVGSLVPSHYKDLLARSVDTYDGEWDDMKYFRVNQKIAGIECALVMTYNPRLHKKQMITLQNGIEKIQNEIKEKIQSYKHPPIDKIPQGVATMKKESHYGKFFEIEIKNGIISFCEKTEKTNEEKNRFGKNLLFSNKLCSESTWIIEKYKDKNLLEQDFNLLKDPELIRNRPIRHWTDTKIRSFCFCCVIALLLVRIMQLMARKFDLEMSPSVLKQELQDLKLITWVDHTMQMNSKISSRSTIQQKLWEIFGLQEIENQIIS